MLCSYIYSYSEKVNKEGGKKTNSNKHMSCQIPLSHNYQTYVNHKQYIVTDMANAGTLP